MRAPTWVQCRKHFFNRLWEPLPGLPLCRLDHGPADLAGLVGGGEADSADSAAAALSARYPGLRIAGTVVPPFGFEAVPGYLDELYDRIVDSAADLVYVGLGFPKQERFAAPLSARMPATWFLGCGGGIGMAAGTAKRSPRWVQQLGLEWTHRLAQEPRRLAKRYLVDDIPAALLLLGMSARTRLTRRAQ